MGSYRYRSLTYRRSIYLIEALYTLNSPPVVSFKLGDSSTACLPFDVAAVDEYDVGALLIRIGFWASIIFLSIRNKEPPKPYSIFFGPYIA